MKTVFLLSTIIIVAGALIFLVAKNTKSNSYSKKGDGEKLEASILNYSVKDNGGNKVNLADYKGKVLLIVNVASKCGYTKQYKGLEQIYRKYKDSGFEILAFPCNDFGGQEPGTNEQIADFCSTNYDVTFKLFDKIKVKGNEKEPLYAMLTNNGVTGTDDIGWNFEKFLIAKDGNVVKKFKSKVDPLSDELTSLIESELEK
ncbi:MAG TPA: glutathione peroxidase [Ignavibacteriaceae bacterium]|nr:glutathione peroxidase [Ignavibacteriaceae bacterium]